MYGWEIYLADVFNRLEGLEGATGGSTPAAPPVPAASPVPPVGQYGLILGVGGGNRSEAALTANTATLYPFALAGDARYDALSFHKGSAGVGTASIRFGIFGHDDTTGLPGTLITQATCPVTAGQSAPLVSFPTPVDLPAARYWLGVVGQGTGSSGGIYLISGATALVANGDADFLLTNMICGWIYTPTVTGAFGAAMTGTIAGSAASVPRVGLRRAAA